MRPLFVKYFFDNQNHNKRAGVEWLFTGLAMLYLLIPATGYCQRYASPEDSLLDVVDTRADTLRNGFFHTTRFNSTFHIQADGNVTYLFSQAATMTGFQADWVINHKISIGLRYDILASPIKLNKYINTSDSLNGNVNTIHPLSMSAAISIGYIFLASAKVSIEPTLNIGWADISFTDPKAGWLDTTENKNVNFSANYFMVNPSLSMIWNATKYFRLGAQLGIKGVFGQDYLRVKSYRVGGIYGGLFFRFGTF